MCKYTLLMACLLLLTAICASMQAAERKDSGRSLQDAFARSKHSDTFRKYWDDHYKATEGGKTLRAGRPPYPTETGVVFLSAWLSTGEDRYRKAAIAHFEFAHSLENDDGLLVTELGICRDPQARQIYNFYTAYKLLKDKKYLEWADRCAKGMLDSIPRLSHEVLGKSYNTFVAGYFHPERPYDVSGLKPWVDVNQNAEAALAYTQLYHESGSKFYKSAEAKAVVMEEMNAGLALQDSDTGSLPLAEGAGYAKQLDTGYGSYVLFSWVWLNTYWHNADWQKRIEHAGRWISGFSRGEGKGGEHFYPAYGEYLSGWEMWYRVPVLWKIGFSPEQMIDQYIGTYAPQASPGERAYVVFAYFELMHIPPQFYLTPKPK